MLCRWNGRVLNTNTGSNRFFWALTKSKTASHISIWSVWCFVLALSLPLILLYWWSVLIVPVPVKNPRPSEIKYRSTSTLPCVCMIQQCKLIGQLSKPVMHVFCSSAFRNAAVDSGFFKIKTPDWLYNCTLYSCTDSTVTSHCNLNWHRPRDTVAFLKPLLVHLINSPAKVFVRVVLGRWWGNDIKSYK